MMSKRDERAAEQKLQEPDDSGTTATGYPAISCGRLSLTWCGVPAAVDQSHGSDDAAEEARGARWLSPLDQSLDFAAAVRAACGLQGRARGHRIEGGQGRGEDRRRGGSHVRAQLHAAG